MNEENNIEVFQCICGKEFNDKKSFGKHKNYCKIYQQYKKQEKEYKRLPNGMFKCENPDCNNEHDGSYGSGRFCCEQCKIQYISLINTNAHNPKVKAHLDKLRKEGKVGKQQSKYGTWKCNHCNQIFETRAKLRQHIVEKHYCISNVHNLECPFCGKIFKTHQAKGGHIINCKNHPQKEFYQLIHKKAGKTFKNKIKSGSIIPHWKGKKHSEESKQKMRESTCRYLQHNNPTPCRYNKKAISFFDNLSIQNNWTLQHAENGGEFYTGIGYWLDAYDKEKNIVVEYDESYHYDDVENNILREKDLKRQKEIIEHLHCEFWRYNETTKCLWKVKIN